MISIAHRLHTVSRQCRHTYTYTSTRDYYFYSTFTNTGEGRGEGRTHSSPVALAATSHRLVKEENEPIVSNTCTNKLTAALASRKVA